MALACEPSTFHPSLFATDILSVSAKTIDVSSANKTVCNVTLSYTHPGQDDLITVESWLPLQWNGRLQAVGGGGWATGRFIYSHILMEAAVADGFATVTTDSGVDTTGNGVDRWALSSPGNVNWNELHNWASRSLEEEAYLVKGLIADFYGKGPEFSYWWGCSQGGRQGLALAQRYPTLYDGIIAGAPGIDWSFLASYAYMGQQTMNELDTYPFPCEFNAITIAAVTACDELDGIRDGVISQPSKCQSVFSPFDVVGKLVDCPQSNNRSVMVSETAAKVAEAIWQGLTSPEGVLLYPGINPDANLTGDSRLTFLAMTDCRQQKCVGVPTNSGTQWLINFAAKKPDLDLTTLSRAEFDELVYYSNREYAALLSMVEPDLSRFQKAGGKMITFHGMADPLIPSRGTERYYKKVTEKLQDTQEFYRYFEVPGLAHCEPGVSGMPEAMFEQLQAWVEEGVVPVDSPVTLTLEDGTIHERIVCPYPKLAQLGNGCDDPARRECWSCELPDHTV